MKGPCATSGKTFSIDEVISDYNELSLYARGVIQGVYGIPEMMASKWAYEGRNRRREGQTIGHYALINVDESKSYKEDFLDPEGNFSIEPRIGDEPPDWKRSNFRYDLNKLEEAIKKIEQKGTDYLPRWIQKARKVLELGRDVEKKRESGQ